MVYLDKARNKFGRMLMSHMIADTLEELHAMAQAIGVQRKWFQGQGSTPHYDVCQSKRADAVKRGAVELGRGEYVGVIQRLREARKVEHEIEQRALDARREYTRDMFGSGPC